MERRLHALLGPADRYRVRIVGTRDADLVRGRARQIQIEGSGIHAREEMRLEWLRLALYDVRYEDGDPDFLSIRSSDLEVEFTDTALNEYLRLALPRYEPEIRFEQDRVRVRLKYTFLGIPTQITAAGRLVIQDGRRLLFDADEADVSFAPSREFAEQFVEDRINPVLDLNRIEFPARLETVRVLPGRLHARGIAAIRTELRD